MSAPIVHVEIPAKDYDTADKFYSEVFGWKITVDKQFNYHMFESQGGPGGGFIAADGKNSVLPYLASDDIDATLNKVNAAGGKTVTPKTEIPGMGWFAVFTDPTGNRIGLFSELHPH